MTLVKAQMSFYHDAVGTRAKDEVFEVKTEQLANELESAGYVKSVQGQEATAHQEQQNLQQQMGQKQALTNEAVSMAHHVQNQQAAQHQQNVAQIRQQQQQQAQNQAQSQNTSAQSQAETTHQEMGQQHVRQQMAQAEAQQKMEQAQAKAKKADK